MKRPSTMRLSLMGGGAVLAIGTGIALIPGESEDCRRARAMNAPDLAAFCSSSSSSRSSSSFVSSTSYGGSDSSSSSSSVSRGGFGGSAHASSSSGS